MTQQEEDSLQPPEPGDASTWLSVPPRLLVPRSASAVLPAVETRHRSLPLIIHGGVGVGGERLRKSPFGVG